MGHPAKNGHTMTRAEYDAWVEEHGHTPTWGPCRVEPHPGAIRQHDDQLLGELVP